MSAEKAELRAAAVHEVGIRIDDLLEASNGAVQRCEGAAHALQQASEIVRGLHTQIEKAVEDKLYDLRESAAAKAWITRAVEVLDQLARNGIQQLTVQRGHAAGVQSAVLAVKAVHAAEVARGVPIEERAEGIRTRIKDRRNSEAGATVDIADVEEEPKPKTRRRRRVDGITEPPSEQTTIDATDA